MKKITNIFLSLILVSFVSIGHAATIKWSMPGDSLTLDPHAQNEGPTHMVSRQVYEGLVTPGINMEILPQLATSWEATDSDTWVFTLHGDGELQEGQIWEAAMYAAHNKIDNIISFVDCNGQQIDGSTDDVLSLLDLSAKWSAFGWNVLKCDGHSLDDLDRVIKEAKSTRGSGVPSVVLMETVMGKGVDFMEGTHKWHGIAPNDEQLADALSQLEETEGDY